METPQFLRTKINFQRAFRAVFSDQGNHLLLVSENKCCIYQVANQINWNLLKSLNYQGQQSAYRFADLSPDGKRALVVDGKGKLWLAEGKNDWKMFRKDNLRHANAPLFAAIWLADSKALVTISAGRLARWDSTDDRTPLPLQPQESNNGTVKKVNVSLDRKHVVFQTEWPGPKRYLGQWRSNWSEAELTTPLPPDDKLWEYFWTLDAQAICRFRPSSDSYEMQTLDRERMAYNRFQAQKLPLLTEPEPASNNPPPDPVINKISSLIPFPPNQMLMAAESGHIYWEKTDGPEIINDAPYVGPVTSLVADRSHRIFLVITELKGVFAFTDTSVKVEIVERINDSYQKTVEETRQKLEGMKTLEKTEMEAVRAEKRRLKALRRFDTSPSPPPQISALPPRELAQNYNALMQESMDLLGKLYGKQWTDHNPGDPGITLLESLCYAVTELSYRLSFDMEDLLASWDQDFSRDLYLPEQLLPTRPVTIPDWRRLLITLDGVADAWVNPANPYDGRYEVKVRTGSESQSGKFFRHSELLQLLHANRNLGQSFKIPVILREKHIYLEVVVEPDPLVDKELLREAIFSSLAAYISPPARKTSLQGLLDRGMDLPDALEGPFHSERMIALSDISKGDQAREFKDSQLMEVVQRMKEVIAVVSLKFGFEKTPQSDDGNIRNMVSISGNYAPVLDPCSQILFVGESIRKDENEIWKLPRKYAHISTMATLTDYNIPVSRKLPQGKVRDTGTYSPLAAQLPQNYGVDLETPLKELAAPARQLKAFLLHFDLMLAEYFARVENLASLFSFHQDDQPQLVTEVPGSKELLLSEQGEPVVELAHRLTFLNHLIARFGEDPGQVGILAETKAEQVAAKQAFLQDYPRISMDRGGGFDVSRPYLGTDRLGGFERRISRMIGLPDTLKQVISQDNPLGFYLVEHILLQYDGVEKENQSDSSTNPHANSLQNLLAVHSDDSAQSMTFVFLAEGKLYNKRDEIEGLIRREVPLHLHYQIKWMTVEEMATFESYWRPFLEFLQKKQSRG